MFPRKQIKANARAALSANYWPVVGYPILIGLILMVVLSITSFGPLFSMTGGLSGLSARSMTEAIMAQSTGVSFASDGITILLSIFVIDVIAAGEVYFYYKFYSGSEGDFTTFFEGFRDGKYLHVVGGMLLMSVYIMLWTIAFSIIGTVLISFGGGLLFVSNGVGVVCIIFGIIFIIVAMVIAFIKAYQYSMIPYLLIDRPDMTIKESFAMTKKMTDGNKWSLFVLDLSFIGWWLLSILTLFLLAIFYVAPYQSLASAGAYDYLKRIHMPESVYNGPVFQSASYEANYTGESSNTGNTESWSGTPTSNNEDIFDE